MYQGQTIACRCWGPVKGIIDVDCGLTRSVLYLLTVTWICLVSASFPFEPVSIEQHSHSGETKGESGVVCTKFKRRCLANVSCSHRKCVCPAGFNGNGLMECVEDGNLLCLVTADPHLSSYKGARANVDLPCRYRLTRFVTGHKAAKTPHAYCSVEVSAINELSRGRYYVRSVHISLGITDSGQQVHEQIEVHKFGVTEDQIYKFEARLNKTRTVWGFSRHETINGVDVFPTFDEENNFAVLAVPECGLRIKYRAYEPGKRRQHLLPGISIMAPPDLSFVEGYGHYPHSLCGTDKDDHKLYRDRARELGLKNKHLAIIYDILNEAAPQHANPKRQECEAAMHAFNASGVNQVDHINICGPIETSEKTRTCIMLLEEDPINVLTVCIRYQQTKHEDYCLILKKFQNYCGPKWRGPKVTC